ncbi:phosphoethanolamine transferase [Nostoc sp. NIES-2111]
MRHEPDQGGQAGAATRLIGTVWRYRLPILASLFLLSPVVIFDIALSVERGRGIDKLSLFALPASICWLLVAQGVFRRLWVAHLLLFPFYCFTVAELYLITKYDMRLTSSTIGVMLENLHHTWDFARMQGPVEFLGIVALVLAFAALLWGMRNLRVGSWKPLGFGLAGAALVYGAVVVHGFRQFGDLPMAAMNVVSHDRNSPFGVIPQSAIARIVYNDAMDHQRKSAGFKFNASRGAVPSGREVIVLVVGESSRRDRWSLFGHSLPTTPRMQSAPGVIPLTDMVTQQALTQVSVPLMLTRRSINHPKDRMDEKSIISAFREAGFRTFWLSTQQRDQWTGAINRYSGEADVSHFLERRHDGVLVDELRDILEETRDPNAKLFFVLHTQGSHFVFRDRYPSATAPFAVQGDEKSRMSAEYDNSIEYTDQVLGRLVGALTDDGGRTALLYVSDHGENLYDDDRNLFGHMRNNEFDMPIPALLWVSPAFEADEPGKLAAARRNASLPLNTRIVFSTLADLVGITIPDMDVAELSLFSPTLKPPPRMFLKNEKIVNYDDWLETTQKQATLP